MVPFLLYLATALATTSYLWSQLRWLLWGAPVSVTQCAAAFGATATLLAAFVSLVKLRPAAAIALVGGAAISSYILPLLASPDPRFDPPLSAVLLAPLLVLMTAHSLLALVAPRPLGAWSLSRYLFPDSAGNPARIAAIPLTLMACCVSFVAVTFAPSQRDVWSPSLPSDLIVYFDESATDPQINEFLQSVVGIPRPEQGPDAHQLLPEISSITFVQGVEGHTAYAIGLWPDVSDEAREAVKAAIWESPIVYALLENVAPAEVHALPTPSH